MPITLCCSVVHYKNRLAIGKNNTLLVKLKDDFAFLKNITTNSRSKDSKLDKNVIIMGRKTWFSISREKRPLKDRISIVLTNDPSLLKISPYEPTFFNKDLDKNVYFMKWEQFLHFYTITNANVFVIGGGQIYNLFLNERINTNVKPTKVYLTEVYNYKMENDVEPDTFFEPLTSNYRLIGFSELKRDHGFNVDYRILEYRYSNNSITDEAKYLNLAKYILNNGNERCDRTGVGTISSFSHYVDFDISQGIPLLTTKRIPWKSCIEELLWFIRGDTDAKILQRKGVKIWDGNTSREFLDSRGLHHYDTGILGPGYGWQMRFFGAKYSQAFADTSTVDISKIGGFDQIEYIINELKKNPFSRRIMMCYWNPPDFHKTALIPCHMSCQFYVTERNGERYLSCHFNMRSNDLFLGNPFNILSYTVLTYIIAMKCNMKPDRLIYTGGDVHIYKNHINQIKEQLSRPTRSLPHLILNNSIQDKEIKDITIDDFSVVGYFPHPSIKAQMAV